MPNSSRKDIDNVIGPAIAAIYRLNCSLGIYGEERMHSRFKENYSLDYFPGETYQEHNDTVPALKALRLTSTEQKGIQ